MAGDPRRRRTGEVGDGKIFVLPVHRTGEADEAAVTPQPVKLDDLLG